MATHFTYKKKSGPHFEENRKNISPEDLVKFVEMASIKHISPMSFWCGYSNEYERASILLCENNAELRIVLSSGMGFSEWDINLFLIRKKLFRPYFLTKLNIPVCGKFLKWLEGFIVI